MTSAVPAPTIDVAAEGVLRAELARGRDALSGVGPVLAHLVDESHLAWFNDAVIARTRGMVESLARNLVRRAGEDAEPCLAGLVGDLAAQPALLAHCHALALESRMAERLARDGLDPVVSPLLQQLIGDLDPQVGTLAMNVLAAQARFVQTQSRMDIAIEELPEELVPDVLLSFTQACGPTGTAVAAGVRAACEAARPRTVLMSTLLLTARNGLAQALDPQVAGVSLFFSALSLSTGLSRASVVLAAADGQEVRLALMLAACGVERGRRDTVLAFLLPDIAPRAIRGLDVSPERARALLAEEVGR